MNKKFICIFLVTIISISLLGCGKSKDNSELSKKEPVVSKSSTVNAKGTDKTLQGTSAQGGSAQGSTVKGSASSNKTTKNPTTAATATEPAKDSTKAATTTKPATTTTKPAAASPSKPVTNDPIMALGKLEFSLKDIDGDTYSSKDIFNENKLTMMNIWGTLCTPCINELPELQKLSTELSSMGIGIVGLVGDVNGDDSLDEAKLIVTKKKVDFLNLVPNDTIRDELLSKIKGYPVTIFLDSNGDIVGEVIVGAKSSDEYKSTALKILKTLN